MTLPTGGTVSINYQNYLDSYQNANRWVNSYSGANGSYTFTPQVVSQCQGAGDPNGPEVGCQETMTVYDGNGNKVVYLLMPNNGAWNSQTDYYNNVNGSLVHILDVTTNYNTQNSCLDSICAGGAEWITASCITTTLSDTRQTSQTASFVELESGIAFGLTMPDPPYYGNWEEVDVDSYRLYIFKQPWM